MDSLKDSEEFVKAALNGDWPRVKDLLQEGVNVDQKSKKGSTALHIAAYRGNLEMVQLLIKERADLNIKGKTGWTSMHMASAGGHVDVVTALCNSGAEFDPRDDKGCTPLHMATQNGHTSVIEALAEKGADPNAVTKTRWAPLHYASASGHEEAVTTLVSKGAELESANDNGHTPLHVASINGHAKIVVALIREKAKVDSIAKNGCTPLHLACKWSKGQVVDKLLIAGASVNKQSSSDETPLHFAVRYSDLAVMESLLACKPDLAVKSNRDSTPLNIACFFANIPALVLILHHMGQHELDLKESLSANCANLAAECIRLLADWREHMPAVLPDCDLAELSEQLSKKMNDAGLNCTRATLQSAVADVLQRIEQLRIKNDQIFIVGSFSDGWGSSLSCIRGITDSGSDIDVTDFVAGCEFHLIDICECTDISNSGGSVKYENGHVLVPGKASNPSKCYDGSRLRPAFDLVSAYRCCRYPPIEVIHDESRETHLPPPLLQSLKEEVKRSPCHVVAAAPPGQQGKQLRVSTTFLEKTVIRSLKSVQGQLFILLKYFIKNVICRRVNGLRAYHAKCLLFEMLDRTPAAEWQECNLIKLTKEALNLLLEYLRSNPVDNYDCMPHFFLRDATVYLKKGPNLRGEIAQQVSFTIENLPHLLKLYMSSLKKMEGHNYVFQFHPFMLIPNMSTNVDDVDDVHPGELEYHGIYSAVLNVMKQLSRSDCSEESVTEVIGKMPEESARTARESLRAMACLKFNKRQDAEKLLWSYINEGYTVSKGICPSTIKDGTDGVEMVWNHLRKSDSAWKFCFRIEEPLKFEFLCDFIANSFPTEMNNYSTYRFLNLDALLKCLCLELIVDPTSKLDWFKDVLSDEDADVQQLLMTLKYCNDVDVLIDLIHSHKAAIADHEKTLNAVETLMMEKPELREAISEWSLKELRRQLSDKEPQGATCEALRLLADQRHDTTAAS